jgi:hypothetical protein
VILRHVFSVFNREQVLSASLLMVAPDCVSCSEEAMPPGSGTESDHGDVQQHVRFAAVPVGVLLHVDLIRRASALPEYSKLD